MITALLLDIRGKDPNEYIEQVLDPIGKHLKGFKRLKIFVQASHLREDQLTEWKDAIDAWKKRENRYFTLDVFYDKDGVPTGPCEVWWKNIRLAFNEPEVTRIIYLPYDVCYLEPPTAGSYSRLQSFIDKANDESPDLLLGNYDVWSEPGAPEANARTFMVSPHVTPSGRCKYHIRKRILEDCTLAELWSLFPKSMEWFCRRRSNQDVRPTPRTGFFSLSRTLYTEFTRRRHRPSMLPWAGTVQLLLCAAVNSRLAKSTTHSAVSYKVEEDWIGKLKQPPEPFDHYVFSHQLARIKYVLRDEHEYWTHQIRGGHLKPTGNKPSSNFP